MTFFKLPVMEAEIEHLKLVVESLNNSRRKAVVPHEFPLGLNPMDSGKPLLCDNCQCVKKAIWIGGSRPWKCSFCEVTYETFVPDKEAV